jgi:tRNA threonylcarbamoyladenosine biosynthesis protein TsaB
MAYLLAIETAIELCSVALGKDTTCMALAENEQGNSHAEKLMLLVDQVLKQSGIRIEDVHAVCISEGPGSYTGLRIGLSSAKGICDALNVPLIAIPTLQSMAWGAREQYPNDEQYCPMIDARRMEVYAAVYDASLQLVENSTNVILDENSYSTFLQKGRLIFSGNATAKARALFDGNDKAVFAPTKTSARYLLALAYEKYIRNDFADVAYFEPFYLKEFHSVPASVKGL